MTTCLLALMPMWPVSRNFSSDWYNHLWLIECSGHHLWMTGAPPDVLNTPQAIGMPILLFYGLKFYTALGALSFILGSSLAVRFTAFLVLLAQFYHIRRAVRTAGAPTAFYVSIPVLVTWQVFQATTLFERGDVTEFFATTFLTVCVANLYVFAVRTARCSRDPYGFWTTGLYYGLAAVTHPLTAVYGGAFVSLTGIGILVATRSKRFLKFTALNFALLILTLAPWLWVILRFGRQISITNAAAIAADYVRLFSSSPMSMLLRAFLPTSFCPYTTQTSAYRASMEVNIQLSLPLLTAVVMLLLAYRVFPVRGKAVLPVLRTLLATACGISWITLLGYCSPTSSAVFGHAFDILQFAYRLGTYVNLALLLGTLALLGLVDWKQFGSSRPRSFLCNLSAATLVILCGIGWFSKCLFIERSNVHSEGVRGLEALLQQRHFKLRSTGYWVPGASDPGNAHLADLPATGYFRSAYDVVADVQDGRELRLDTPTQVIPFTLAEPLDSVLPTEMQLNERTLVMTDVNPFPWNHLLLDGQLVTAQDLFAIPSLSGVQFPHLVYPRPYALFIEPGRHTLAYRFLPDPPWKWLNVLSWMTLAGWVVAAGVGTRRGIRVRVNPVLA